MKRFIYIIILFFLTAVLFADINTEFLEAASNGNLFEVKRLLNSGAKINIGNDYSRTALILAAWDGHIDVVKLLISWGASINATDFYNSSALTYAVIGGHIQIVKLLLDMGIKINLRDNHEKNELMEAVEKGHTEIVKLLLEAGADVSQRDNYGHTIFMKSVRYPEIVRILIDAGADVNAVDDGGWTALMNSGPYPETVKLLIEAGVNVNFIGYTDHTALIIMCSENNVESVRLLIAAGARLDLQAKTGYTALITATWYGHPELVELLIEAGADLELADTDGRTVLMHTAVYGKTEIFKLLLAAGADINTRDIYDRTLLINAAYDWNPEMLKLLISEGVDLDVQGDYGNTALIVAASRGYWDNVDILLNAEKKLTLREIIFALVSNIEWLGLGIVMLILTISGVYGFNIFNIVLLSIGGICVLSAPISTIKSLSVFNRGPKAKPGFIAEGEVLRVYVSGETSSDPYYRVVHKIYEMEVKYKDCQSKEYIVKCSPDEPPQKAGDKVTLFYDPGDPGGVVPIYKLPRDENELGNANYLSRLKNAYIERQVRYTPGNNSNPIQFYYLDYSFKIRVDADNNAVIYDTAEITPRSAYFIGPVLIGISLIPFTVWRVIGSESFAVFQHDFIEFIQHAFVEFIKNIGNN